MSGLTSWMRLRVPASSANLGPGFDSLGFALNLHLDCRFRRSAALRITATGCDAAQIPLTAENLIWQTALEVARRVALPIEPVELEIANSIPLGKGLGSSAAALTAGVVIADFLLGLRWKRARILDEAARIEGHPDNVAACVLGSLVASAIDEGGMAHAVQIPLPAQLGVGLVIPDFILPTSRARSVLPDCYSREDVVYNLQRATLMVAALATGKTSVLPAALGDRLHQPYRCELIPGLAEILALRAPGLLGCVLSGAGPSVLVFYERGHDSVCDLARQIFALHGRASEVLLTSVASHGYELGHEMDVE